jgi:XTP/dITP diphosphohydrolase
VREPPALVLVTGNAHKADELAAALPGWRVGALRLEVVPDENGETYAANARIKARAGRAVDAVSPWILGEDSGIEVVALGGAPGVLSARWDTDGVGRLLCELEGVDDRRARYVCTIVALDREGREVVADGFLDGVIAEAQRGSEGFGYDPIMIPLGEALTVAELGDAWKSRNSHRARAAAALAERLA